MSVSLFKSFKQCEAKTMAKLNREWEGSNKDALLLGSYVHAWSEGSLEEFKENHPEMYSSRGKTKGQLKSTFQVADKMIATLKDDELVKQAREGQKEVIQTAELFGVPWKAMFDIYNPDKKVIVDLKTTRNINSKFGNNENFITHYDYLLQMAIYCEIDRINRKADDYFQPHIIAVSKEDIPDKAVILLGTEFIEDKLLETEILMDRVKAVWQGREQPIRCEECDYCRATKKLEKTIFYMDL
ncbi:PD-(D/E)XK nuclease-like domain-containing protein [Clostridium tyrobutyricum]|uniref:PD-(D/E)XK nuclease-like domain-containing protein n=1 Tax=Clostridium tyrobutyricum TaxID=1519 RepID=UPI0020CF6469|nr:PD-(D/E)XK nuclease-like domain-containing protein [Clostridium tyrobutyricum]